MKYKILYLALSIITLTACNSTKNNNQDMKLEMGVMSSMDYLPLAVAQANGYFEQEGLTVNLQKFFSANDRDAAIQSGNLDGSIIDYTGAAIQKAGGVELFFTSQCDGTFELIAGKDAKVSSTNELKGKNIAVARNTVVDFCTDMILKNNEIALTDVQKSEINKIPLRLEMLRNGKIDLTVLPDPFATIAKSDGNPYIISLKDLGYHVTGIVFSKTAIDNNKEAINAFYKAYNRAIVDLQQKPLTDFQDILINEIGFPQPLVANVQLPEYSLAKLPADKDLTAVSEWLKEKELIPADFDIRSLINSDFIPQN